MHKKFIAKENLVAKSFDKIKIEPLLIGETYDITLADWEPPTDEEVEIVKGETKKVKILKYPNFLDDEIYQDSDLAEDFHDEREGKFVYVYNLEKDINYLQYIEDIKSVQAL